jgi:phage shock protein PspC (stress-responsive transcriptional regulator)
LSLAVLFAQWSAAGRRPVLGWPVDWGMISNMSGMNGSKGGKVLERKVNDRMLAGVCSGLAEYTGIDANLMRVIFAAACIFGGLGALVYVVAWVVIPEEGEKESIAERLVNQSKG